MNIALDIETGISEDAMDFQPEWKQPQYKKDGGLYATSKSIEEQKEEWEEKCALSAITGKVLAIGWRWGESEDEMTILTGEEKLMLQNFWTMYDDYISTGHTICGHNLMFFDLPFLVRRSLKYGIKPLWDSKDRYHLQIKDTMLEWGMEDSFAKKYISLDKLARYFGVGVKTGSGADFAKLFNDPKTKQQALDYLSNDLDMTLKVAKKILL
jgi:3'-5' exonuclease